MLFYSAIDNLASFLYLSQLFVLCYAIFLMLDASHTVSYDEGFCGSETGMCFVKEIGWAISVIMLCWLWLLKGKGLGDVSVLGTYE